MGVRLNTIEVLKQYFGYDSFRNGQESIINAILEGRDTLAVMPTGAGKSICYQVPALMLPGVTLVISPLISLMQDQVKSLNENGIHAAYINSSLSDSQISRALEAAAKGTYKIIYVAPERLESSEFIRFASQVQISMVTVDEAHCISQWGQDFRPSYLKIIDFINQLKKRPILSTFTATATEEVKNDIENTIDNRNLQDQILEVIVPLETVIEVKNGSKKSAQRKMFPGYVLINMVMNDDSWYVVRNTRGVTGFVGPGSKPVPLTPAEIKALGIAFPGTATESKPVVSFNGKVGDQVMVLSGAWENTVGVIKGINEGKQCLTINVEMFGRETPVEISFTDVKLM